MFSAANYLNQSGWKTGEPAALAVRLPIDFAWRYARLGYRLPITEWQVQGVVQANGEPLPTPPGRAAIVLPQGARGPAYMVWDNFDVILQWNRSINYALAVAILAEQFLGATPPPRA